MVSFVRVSWGLGVPAGGKKTDAPEDVLPSATEIGCHISDNTA